MTTADSPGLWDFSLALYSQPGVEGLCLSLQEEAGVDVCLLLCTAWLSVRGVSLDRERLAALERLCDPWQRQVVLPLRRVRRHLKGEALASAELAACREAVKTAELAAEKRQLRCCEDLARQWPAAPVTAEPGLPAVKSYLQTLASPALVQRSLSVLQDAILHLAP